MDSKSKFDILLENFSKDKSDATIEKLEVVKTFNGYVLVSVWPPTVRKCLVA